MKRPLYQGDWAQYRIRGRTDMQRPAARCANTKQEKVQCFFMVLRITTLRAGGELLTGADNQ